MRAVLAVGVVMEAAYRRITLVAQLAPADVAPPVPTRHPSEADQAELANVMFDAYRSGVDDPGATRDDAIGSVRTFFDGGFGAPLLDCSFVALNDGEIVAVAFVTEFEGRPLLAQVYTQPPWKNRGLARVLIQLSQDALLARGESVLTLVVTVGNLAAEHLYESMGFVFESGQA